MPSTTSAPSTNGFTTVPPSAMPLISPNALLHAHLTQNPPLRPSNRLPTECRQISLNTSSLTHANGSALIRAGDTAVVCGVRAEILSVHEIANYRVKKTDDVPLGEEDYTEVMSNHLLVPNIELATGCSPKHLPGGPPSVEAQSLSQRLLSLLHTSQVVKKDDLKIRYALPPDADAEERAEGPQLKAYWTLYIDILCVSYGGNVFDVAWLALWAALRDTLLPRAWWDADLKQILCSAEVSEASRLSLQGMPVPLSWSVFVPELRTGTKAGQEEMWVLADPDAFEEDCCEEAGCMVVDAGEKGEMDILKLEKNGGTKVDAKELRALLKLAEERWRQWEKTLKAG